MRPVMGPLRRGSLAFGMSSQGMEKPWPVMGCPAKGWSLVMVNLVRLDDELRERRSCITDLRDLRFFVFVAAEYETPKNSLNQEYNVRPSAGNEKNYFIGRFGSGLLTFGTKKKSSDTRWTLQKEGLQGRQVTDTLKTRILVYHICLMVFTKPLVLQV
ncbi:hypothetical protein Droror1_Dr00017432 [Drosera rotundifolia]